MAVTDLTGTKWRFNDYLYWEDDFELSINFNSNNQSFTTISFSEVTSGLYILGYDSTPAWMQTPEKIGWENEALRLIEITGGSDVTNTTLIQWIQSNAEQIIDSPVLPSFSDVEVTPHEGYITMTINGVDFNLKTAASN